MLKGEEDRIAPLQVAAAMLDGDKERKPLQAALCCTPHKDEVSRTRGVPSISVLAAARGARPHVLKYLERPWWPLQEKLN